MVNKTVITVGIDRRPWGLFAGPGRSANPGPFAVDFARVAPRGVLLPRVGVLAYFGGGPDMGERERIKTLP
jgi:hypothetical protein